MLSTHTRVSLTRIRVNVTLTNAIPTHTSVISMIYTRSVTLKGTNAIPTQTSVISTCTRLISTRRIRFPHAERDFTHKVWFSLTRTSVIYERTRVCDFETHDCDFNTHKSDFYTQCDFDTYERDYDTIDRIIANNFSNNYPGEMKIFKFKFSC
jgi:hypothetical protein